MTVYFENLSERSVSSLKVERYIEACLSGVTCEGLPVVVLHRTRVCIEATISINLNRMSKNTKTSINKEIGHMTSNNN